MKPTHRKTFTAVFVLLLMVTAYPVYAQGESSIPEAPTAPSPVVSPPQQSSSVSVSLPTIRSRARAWNVPDRYGPTGCVLVVPNKEIETEALLASMTDMTVMSRVFDKKLAAEHLIPPTSRLLGRTYDTFQPFCSPHQQGTGAIYLQGYAAMFFVNVDFPLWTPVESPEKETAEGVDKLWEDTITEMYYPDQVNKRDKDEQQYDAEQVQELKETLIRTLKHAANIRCMESQEWLTVVVKGKSSGDVTKGSVSTRGGKQDDFWRYDALQFLSKASAAADSTFLSIRAKKQDIDAFAEGTLDYEQFRRHTEVLTY